jgi:hypothetical protein
MMQRVHGHGRTLGDLARFDGLAGCVLVRTYIDEHGRLVGEWDCPDVEEGQPMATATLLEGLTTQDYCVGQVPLLRGTPAELHAFVQRRVRFVPEEVETFQSPAATLALGYGDCDDSARALVAIAERAGYPARLVYFLQDGQPAHVCAQIKVPRGSAGRARTGAVRPPQEWGWAETTVAARFGEHPFAAMNRLRLRRSDMSGTPYILRRGMAVPLAIAPRGGTMRGMGQLPANLGPDFPSTLASLSASIGADPLDILALLLSESSLVPSAQNSKGFTGGGSAVGINQLAGSPPNAGNWSYFAPLSASQYMALTAEQQLPYVFAYFRNVMNGHGLSTISGRDLYVLNFLPAYFTPDSPDSAVLVNSSSPYFAPNAGLSGNGTTITYGDMQNALDRQKSSTLYQEIAPLIGTVQGSPPFSDTLLFLLAAGAGAALARYDLVDKFLRSFA